MGRLGVGSEASSGTGSGAPAQEAASSAAAAIADIRLIVLYVMRQSFHQNAFSGVTVLKPAAARESASAA